MRKRRYQRGDTIVEVALAFTIFAMLAVGSVTVMTRSSAVEQRSLEQTEVGEVMAGQADLLRAAQSNPTLWSDITGVAFPDSSTLGTNTVPAVCPAVPPQNSFFIGRTADSSALTFNKLSSSNFQVAPVTSTIDYATSQADGVWVQAAKVGSNVPGGPTAYDMYIHSCWDTVDSNVPATLVTIVRLYNGAN